MLHGDSVRSTSHTRHTLRTLYRREPPGSQQASDFFRAYSVARSARAVCLASPPYAIYMQTCLKAGGTGSTELALQLELGYNAAASAPPDERPTHRTRHREPLRRVERIVMCDLHPAQQTMIIQAHTSTHNKSTGSHKRQTCSSSCSGSSTTITPLRRRPLIGCSSRGFEIMRNSSEYEGDTI